jgi:hypothetical protein
MKAKFEHICNMRYFALTIFSCFTILNSSAQTEELKEDFPTFFAISGSAVIPNKFQGTKNINLTDSVFSVNINQRVNRSFGAMMRQTYSDRFGLEFGLMYTIRNYDIEFSVIDSNVRGTNDLKFVTYDIPINGLVFLKMSENIFVNAALGTNILFKPSAVAAVKNIGKHQFSQAGLLTNKFGFDLNAQLGVELRTQKNGIFYLGGSVKVPLNRLFLVQANYLYEDNKYQQYADANGGYISIDLRYFLRNVKNKGPQPIKGPAVE